MPSSRSDAPHVSCRSACTQFSMPHRVWRSAFLSFRIEPSRSCCRSAWSSKNARRPPGQPADPRSASDVLLNTAEYPVRLDARQHLSVPPVSGLGCCAASAPSNRRQVTDCEAAMQAFSKDFFGVFWTPRGPAPGPAPPTQFSAPATPPPASVGGCTSRRRTSPTKTPRRHRAWDRGEERDLLPEG